MGGMEVGGRSANKMADTFATTYGVKGPNIDSKIGESLRSRKKKKEKKKKRCTTNH